jgi:hypothetical protein
LSRRQVALSGLECRLLAQSGHFTAESKCPLSGIERTSARRNKMSAKDPKQTLTLALFSAWLRSNTGRIFAL